MKTWEDIQKAKNVAYGIEVRKRRDGLKITQRKLAKRIGVKQNVLIRYELGLEPCPEPVRNRIEEVLGPIETNADSKTELANGLQTDAADTADTAASSVRSRKKYSKQVSENHKTMAREFGLELLRTRMRLGLTANELAGALCTDASTISRYECGALLPRPATMLRLRRRMKQLIDGADEGLSEADSRTDVRENAAQHEEAAAVCEPAPPIESDNAPPLPEESQEAPQFQPFEAQELQPFDKYQEYFNRVRIRQDMLSERGLAHLSSDAFYKLCDYLQDLLGNKNNLDSRFAGVDS